MSGRSGVRLAVGALAIFAAGCGSSRAFQPVPAYPSADAGRVIARAADKNPPGPLDNRYAPPLGPAASSSWPSDGRFDRGMAGRLPVTPGRTWPDPEVTRAGYGDGLGDGQLTGQPAGIPLRPAGEPLPLPRSSGYPNESYGGYAAAAPRGPGPGGNPRQTPTPTGDLFNLGPNETSLDRAVELARRIDLVNRENQALLARIGQLEEAAKARETALNETLRDVQIASDEVARTRAEIQNVRKELAAVKARVMQVEQDEAETLKAIIAAIEKLLQQPLPTPDNGGSKK